MDAFFLAELPVFDAHVDSLQRQLDLGHDLGVRGPGQLDLERGRAGGLGAVVLVSWCDPKHLPDRAGERTRLLLAEYHRLLARHPDTVAFAGNGEDLARARATGRVAAIAGIEGGHSIEGSLDSLRWFFAHGVRVLTLVWNNHLPWIRSCQDGAGPEVPAGLSAFGRGVVREMNRLGMLVDLSHAGVQAFHDALEESERPVVASHSGCRALHDHPRNLNDDQLRALTRNGGVMGVVFHPGFLDEGARAEENRVRGTAAYRRLADEIGPDPDGRRDTELFLRQSELLQRAARPLDADRLADHVLHAIEVAGIEHVGIGSDYDGIQRAPRGLEDASCYGRLAERLLARGLDEADLRAVLGGNMARAFAAATGPGTEAAEAELLPLGEPAPADELRPVQRGPSPSIHSASVPRSSSVRFE